MPTQGRVAFRNSKAWAILGLLLTATFFLSWSQHEKLWSFLAYIDCPLEVDPPMRYQLKRYPWLPGPIARFPDQICGECLPDSDGITFHRTCQKDDRQSPLRISRRWPNPPEDTLDALWQDQKDFRCICTHEYHSWCSSCLHSNHEHTANTGFCGCPDESHRQSQ